MRDPTMDVRKERLALGLRVALPAEKIIVSPLLVGRERYLDALEPILRDVASNGARIIAISAEAGVGKSRLVDETKQRVAAIAGERGIRVMQGQCFEPDSSLPYAPIIDLLRTCIAVHEKDELAECIGGDGAELAKLVPELRTLIPGLPTLAALEPEQERRRIFHAVCEFLARLAAQHPLLVVIEDVHWSDDTSLELLAQFARRIKTLPIVMLITFRSDEVRLPVQQLLSALDREHMLLEWRLERLGLHEAERMIQSIFELDGPIPSDLLHDLYALTEGSPFFIEEVLKSLVAAGDIFYGRGGWEAKPIASVRIPRSIQAAVSARTARLTPDAARTLVIAAVAGRRFDFDLLQAMTSNTEDELLEVIKELIGAQLVVEQSAERFAFRHALTRQAIYLELLARERRSLHRQIAEALRDVAAASPDARLGELAHHFFAAESWEEAYEYCARQAEAARAMNAPAAAVREFSRAIEAAGRLHTRVPAAMYRARGQAYEATGDFDNALADYERTYGMATSGEGADRAAECQALLDLGFLWAGRDYERAGEFFERASEVAGELGEPVLEARTLNRLGNWLINTGDTPAGVQLHERALAAFRSAGDEDAVVETLDLLGMGYALNGDPRAGVEALTSAIEQLRPHGPGLLLCSSLTSRATWYAPNQCEVSYSSLATFEQSSRGALEAIALAQQLDSPAALSYANWVAGGVHEAYGHFGEAQRFAGEGLRLAIDIGHEQWIAGARFTLGRLAFSMLAQERAIAELLEGVRLARSVASAWWLGSCGSYLALAYIQAGDLTAAESLLASTWAESHEPRSIAERRILWAWGRLALARDEPDRAVAIADRVIASAGTGLGDAQAIPEPLRLKGEALLALKQPDLAAEVLSQARDAALGRGATPTVWQIRGVLARAYQMLRRPEDAERELDAARRAIGTLAQSIEQASERDRFEGAALEMLPRLRAPSANRIAKQAFGGLTAREREVAVLIARGKSNRDIADELVLGERTIETHAGNILSKLGFASRTQIAAWAVESGLTRAS